MSAGNGGANTSDAKIDTPSVIDPKVLQKQTKSVIGAEQAPTTRDQTPTDTDWKRLSTALGQPYDPTSVPLNKLREMREDPIIAFGLHYKRVPLVRANWHMDARDRNGPNAQVAAFMDAAWREIHARFMLQATLDYDFGYQALVKRFKLDTPNGVYIDENGQTQPIWNAGAIQPIMWRPFTTVEPEKVTPKFVTSGPRSGEFDGFEYEMSAAAQAAQAGSRGPRKSTMEVDVYHALWCTNERDGSFGSLYGRPLIRHAYRYWWSYWYRWAQYDRAFERMAIPPIVAYHPPGFFEDDDTGERISYQDIALNAAERLRSNAIAAVPSTMATSGLEEKGTTEREWKFEFLEVTGNPFQHFDDSFNYLDIRKLRALWIPEQAFVESTGGSGGRTVATQMAEIFTESQALKWDEEAAVINDYVLPQLLQLNFPEFVANGGKCRIIGHGFAQEDIDLLKQLIQLVGQADPASLGVDIREALRRLNVPLLTPEQQYNAQQQLINQGAASTPPAVNGGTSAVSVVSAQRLNGQTNGGSVPQPNPAGSSLTGFSDDYEQRMVYVQPGESIVLSASEDFIASLPSSMHFDDKALKALALQLRKLWLGQYRMLYPDFASYVNDFDINLSDDAGEFVAFADRSRTKKEAIKLANKLLNGWKHDSEGLEDLRKRSRAILEKMVKRATKLAQGKFNIDGTPDDDAVSSFLDSAVERLVNTTHDTVRDELHEFVVGRLRSGNTKEEIANEIRAHFDGFPEWKSSRVAHNETRDAVNATTLLTAEASKLKYVRMRDGEEFDKDCRERNGKLATIREAWKQLGKEHPFGTLGFEPIPRADFSVKYVEHLPTNGDGRRGYLDPETCTAYLMSDATEVEEKILLGVIADQLIEEHERG